MGSASQLNKPGSEGIAPEAVFDPMAGCEVERAWLGGRGAWDGDTIRDLKAQLLMVGRLLYQERINKDILERQLSGLKMDYGNYMAIRDQQNDIATFIRQNYVMEIYRGEHAGKDLVAILRRYLGIERSRWSVKLRYWWWWLTSRERD